VGELGKAKVILKLAGVICGNVVLMMSSYAKNVHLTGFFVSSRSSSLPSDARLGCRNPANRWNWKSRYGCPDSTTKVGLRPPGISRLPKPGQTTMTNLLDRPCRSDSNQRVTTKPGKVALQTEQYQIRSEPQYVNVKFYLFLPKMGHLIACGR
jgi:hypothetical protein